MQMSEPLATTVAAVAPVTWLVGALEAHQVMKRVAAHGRERALALRAALERALAAEDMETARRELGGVDSEHRVPRFLGFMYFLWIATSGALITAVAISLSWLSEDGGPGAVTGKGGVAAAYCCWSLVLSFMLITVGPLVALLGEHWPYVRDRIEVRAQIDDLQVLINERSDAGGGGTGGTQNASPPS